MIETNPPPTPSLFVTYTLANSYTHDIHESLIITPPTPYNHTHALMTAPANVPLGLCPFDGFAPWLKPKGAGAKQEIHFT